MLIANPMYDVVFKYLMSDNNAAKLLIGAIIGEEIVELDFRPTEYQSDIESHDILVYRIDFSAKIRQADGSEKLVLIEVQKAKFPSDIMRFRRYLGNQYANENNVLKEERMEYNAIPILTIYFLGHKLRHTNAPVIKVQRDYINVITGEKIKEREAFIESLTHDSFIIQVPYLSEKRQTELEKLLAVFDQSHSIENRHFLDVNDEDYPEKYREVIRRLVRAASEVEVRKTMTVEDEVKNDLDAYQRQIQEKTEELQEKTEELQDVNEELQEKTEEIQKKEEKIQEKEEVICEKENVIKKALELLMRSGISEEQAKKELGI